MNTFSMIFGYLCVVVLLGLILRPAIRGISSGLFMTVVYYKAGCDLKVVFKQLIKAFTKDPYMWLIGADSCESHSIGDNYWNGIFNWRFDKGLIRKNSLKDKIK